MQVVMPYKNHIRIHNNNDLHGYINFDNQRVTYINKKYMIILDSLSCVSINNDKLYYSIKHKIYKHDFSNNSKFEIKTDINMNNYKISSLIFPFEIDVISFTETGEKNIILLL